MIAELNKLKYILFIELSLLIVYAVFNYIPFLVLLAVVLLIPTIYLIFTYPIFGTLLLMFSILAGSIGVVKVSGKTPAILIVDIVFLLICLIFIIKILLSTEKEINIPTITLLWVLFLVWSILGLFIAIEKFRTLVMWKNYFAGFITLSFTFYAIKKELHVKYILIGMIVWGVFLSIIEFKILLDLGGLSGGIIGLYFRKNLLATSWGRSNYLATFFVMIIPVTIGYILYTKSYKSKIFLLFSLLIMTTAMILTLSRGGLLSLLVAIIVLFSRVIKRRTLIPIFVSILVVVIVALLNPLTYVIINRISNIEVSSSVFTRINFYGDVWKTFINNPITGVGFGNLGLYAQFVIPLNYTTSAHNIILGMLGETGIVGAILFLSILGIVAREIWKKVKAEKYEPLKFLKWACFSAFIGALLHSLMEPNLEGMQFSVMFWGFMAACLKLELLRKPN